MEIDRFEVRDGGRWRYLHREEDGTEYGFHGVFHGDPTPDQMVQTFEFEAGLQYDNVQDYTRKSRYLLYENGTFILQYPNGQYRGIYERTGDLVTFRWEGWNIQGEWRASGTVAGNSMAVRYNDVMLWTDFEDATYRLSD